MDQGRNYADKMSEYRLQTEEISKTILAQMKQSTNQWEMPWHKGLPQAINPVTGKHYGGNNLLLLWNVCLKKNYTVNKWATLKQWRRKKAMVRRGEKGTLICFAIPIRNEQNRNIQLSLFEPTNLKDICQDNTKFTYRFRTVFNASQVKGYTPDLPDLFNPERPSAELIQQIIEKSNAKIITSGEEAFYRFITDEIYIPHIARFVSTPDASQMDNYHATLLHELIHWTGHETRCKRHKLVERTRAEYALEELVAELGSAILCTQIKQKSVPPLNHANYLNSWIKVLKNDFSYFTEALELARTAIYFLNLLTGIYPYKLQPQYEREIYENHIERWKEIIESESSLEPKKGV